MKKHYKILIALFVFSAFCTSLVTAQRSGKMLFTARLSGAKEVPANTSIAKGLVTVVVEGNDVIINAVFDSLTGPVTACHLHKAIAGANGGTFTNFLANVRGNRLYVKTTLTNAQIGDMMEDSVYLNVHTAANGGGEIRGQLSFQTDPLFAVVATGAKEVPATTSPATAVGSLLISSTVYKVSYKIVANGLTGPITSAHLHFGAANATGAVVYPLTFNGNVLSGSVATNQAFEDSLVLGKIYVNIHTAANPNGEIRGQMFYAGDGIGFDGLIEGAQENPAVTTNAKGAMFANIRSTLDTLDYSIQITGLTPIAAHFHSGAAGTNGGVIVNLTPASAAFPNAYSGKVALTPAIISAIVKDSFYANFHTTANQGGEIRGQVLSVLRTGLVANLCGGQEIPAIATNASGAGFISLARDKSNLYLDIVTNGLSSNATGAHIHKGAKGVAGPVTINLTPFIVGNAISSNGGPGVATGTSLLTSTFVDSIANGLTYFNVHTAANGGGEVRGQISNDLVQECLANSVLEINGERLNVKVAPNPTSGELNILFDSNENFNAEIIVSDILGRQISTDKVNVLRGANRINVNVAKHNNGIYLLQMRQNNRLLFSDKVIKN